MNAPKVSVIIPVYNSQKYITECIDSVLGQTLQDFEIICVDDGSGDSSDSLLKEYAKADKRFVLFSQTNKGVSSARNIGIKNARGEYIYFLDSDDYIEPDTLEITCKLLDAKHLDIVYFDLYAFGEEGISQADVDAKNRYYARNHVYNAMYSGKELFYKLLENKDYSCSVCKQVIRKEFLQKNKVQFYEGIVHEDELYTLQTMLLAERVVYIPKTLHHRRLRKNSIMTRPIEYDSVYGYFVCVKEAYTFLLQKGYSQKELNIFLGLLKRLITNARNQYIKLADSEQKKYTPLPEEEKFLFQLCIADSLDIMKQRDKVAAEKQNLIKERETTVVKINELQQKATVLEQARAETEKKLQDLEAQFNRAQAENRQHVKELQQKATALEQVRVETEQKLHDTEAQFNRAQGENRQHIVELQQKIVQLKHNKIEMEDMIDRVRKELAKERDFNQKQLEEKLQKVKQLEQIKQDLAREQAFSQKQLDEKLKTGALLEKVKAEAEQKVSELNSDIKKEREIFCKQLQERQETITELEKKKEETEKILRDTELVLEKEKENSRKLLGEEKEKNIQLKLNNEAIQKDLQKTKKQAESALRELSNVKTGWSFRTGRVITFVPRKIRDWLR